MSNVTFIKPCNGTWVVIHNGMAVYANGSKEVCEAWVKANLQKRFYGYTSTAFQCRGF